MYLYAEQYVSYFNSSSWSVMSYFKINPMKQQCCCSTARFAVTGSFSLTALLLETGISRQHASLPSPTPSMCQNSLWGSSFQTSSVFHLGTAVESLQMQMLPERKRCYPERVEGHCSQEAMLVQCNDMAPPAFGEPPESTTLPTTKECEASSIWEKVEVRRVSHWKHFS